MPRFQVKADFAPTGDQPQAVAALAQGLEQGLRHQVLHGATGTGKTATMAWTIEALQRPALVMSPNKTLAAQLCAEFKSFFPDNAVEYFVSYYDYFQPEAYIARTDTYIEKDSSRNDEIDRLRNAATRALLTRRDVVVVASVSCIYGIGSPMYYLGSSFELKVGDSMRRDILLRKLNHLQYERNDYDFGRSRYRVRGDVVDVQPSYEESAIRLEFWGDTVERIVRLDPVTGEVIGEEKNFSIFPATHYVTPEEQLPDAIADIETELRERVAWFQGQGRLLEAQRLEQRTNFDLEMLRLSGTCAGVENYSRPLSRRGAGEAPFTLLDYLPADTIVFVDESHVGIPQIGGMHGGDRSRKIPLIEYGFRLPSAADNRPLTFEEWDQRVGQVVYVSATPGEYENTHAERVVEQLIRPTGLVDPPIEVRATTGQVDDLVGEIRRNTEMGHRTLVTTLTKRMAENLTDFLRESDIRVNYLHSDVETLERVEILRDLRLGVFDVLVGINLLREGLDLPEVALVAILDADKEGYLRSNRSLIQTIGRAARNIDGRVIMYADRVTESMRSAIDETERRRAAQTAYNEEHGLTPETIQKAVTNIETRRQDLTARAADQLDVAGLPPDDLLLLVRDLERAMKKAARDLEFEKAADLRDRLVQARRQVK
ncbi:MAG: excinuclease ABC subunit UvrB [Candidatus Dormibacteria bacterium]